MNEEAETVLSSVIHMALFATAETFCVKAHKQVGSSQLEEDSQSEGEENKERLVCVYEGCSQKLALQ